MSAEAERPKLWSVTVAALLVLIAWEVCGLDLVASRLFVDESGFVWRDHWLAQRVLHDGGRWVAGAVLASLLARVVWPGRAGPSRRERSYWLLVTLACFLLVPALKRLSDTSCPWSLAEFGGALPYVAHWRLGVTDGGPGHCFPSGHAVAAFGLLPQYFLWRARDGRRARAWLAAVALLGLLFGGAQLVRGAHFVSHTLWSAWLCWTLALVAAQWAPGGVPTDLTSSGTQALPWPARRIDQLAVARVAASQPPGREHEPQRHGHAHVPDAHHAHRH